jgi:serine/threonine protein kinase
MEDTSGGWYAFVDHFRDNLCIRDTQSFAHGAQKKVYDLKVYDLICNSNGINGSKDNLVSYSCRSSALPLVETTGLDQFDCDYIIKKPYFFGKIILQGARGDVSYEYGTLRANAKLSPKFVQETNLQPTQMLTYALQMATALSHIHSKNFVHSDVKGDNILLFGNTNEVAKLSDFGSLAKPSTFSPTTQVEGVTYISPEMCSGKLNATGEREGEKDCPHDMWALGITLFELFSPDAERPYFMGEEGQLFKCTREELIERQAEHEVRLAEQLKKWPSDDAKMMALQMLIKTMLVLDPTQRITAEKAVEFIKLELERNLLI